MTKPKNMNKNNDGKLYQCWLIIDSIDMLKHVYVFFRRNICKY